MHFVLDRYLSLNKISGIMKMYTFLLVALLISHRGFAQQKDIEVFEKKEGNKNIVVARNTSKTSYMVTVVINAKGMDVTPSTTVEAVIPGGYMKEMATLVPRPGEGWSYGYEVSFVEYSGTLPKSNTTSAPTQGSNPSTTTSTTSPSQTTTTSKVPVTPDQTSLTTAAIVVYSQAGCGRCSFVKKELDSKGVKYVEIDVNSPSPEINNMWQKLRDGGFDGNSITMPVVRVDGQYHYNIKDLAGFVAALK
jgi:glutaredoxin